MGYAQAEDNSQVDIMKINTYYKNMSRINLRSLDLNLLVALEVLLEERHITQAAERLNVSQSAMSHILSRLRSSLGDELLVRGEFGYVKTPKAEKIEGPLKDALRSVERVFTNNTFDPKSFDGSFQISTLGYGEVIIVPQLMKELMKSAPHSKINIIHRPDATFSKILSGEADLMLGALSDTLHKSCCMEFLFEDTYICLMHESHPLADKALTFENYLEYPHSVIHSGIIANNPIDEFVEKRGKKRKIVKRSSHFMASFFALEDTHLLQTAPRRISTTIASKFGLVEKELPFDLDAIQFGQIWHLKNDNDPIHKWFRTRISKSVSEAGNSKSSS